MHPIIDSPEKLQARLEELFPEFSREMELADESEAEFAKAIGYASPKTQHSIWQTFAPLAHEYLSLSKPKTLLQLSQVINELVQSGGENENAVSTCLLEHASQVGVRKILKPYLSAEAKNELR